MTATDVQPSHEPPQAQLLQMIAGKATTQLIFVAAKLGIADVLNDRPKSIDDLADATGTHAPTLYRVLRALAGLGVFVETDPRYFALTPMGELLQTDTTGSLRDFAILFGSDWHNSAWSTLLHSVRTGEPALDHTVGMELFEYLHAHPEKFEVFNNAMTALSRQDAVAISHAYDFSNFDTIVDVGGGHGLLLAEILKANPATHGVLLEVPQVAEGARATMEEAGVLDRCVIVEGDFFERVPEGADAYILKLIIHDWDDEQARRILENCRAAMPADGTLLVANAVIPPGNDPYIGKLVDIEMLVMTPGGRERTEAEFEQLLAEAGFELTRTIPTPSYLYILEAQPR